MAHRSSVLVGLVLALACGSPAEEPAPLVETPVVEAPAPAPLPTPERFVPANATVRIPPGEARGVAGTDVVFRVDRPDVRPERCAVHVVVSGGDEVRDEAITCETAVVFRGLTLGIDGEGLWVGEGLVQVTIATNGPEEASTASCESDADCTLSTFRCCAAASCDPSAVNVDALRHQTDLCAHRRCAPWEPRPCGAQPDPPPVLRAACVAHVCQVAS